MKFKPRDRVLWRKFVYLNDDGQFPITFTLHGEVVRNYKNNVLVRTYKPNGEPFDRWILNKELEKESDYERD
jgi:hypothetical protein